jgi:SAM-dependent methyltransferase
LIHEGATRQRAFADWLMGLSNSGWLALMVSIGHRTGLFDTMALLSPATTEEIARNAALDERYVREWLAAMATGGIVDYDPRAMTFVLPPERAACLTRAAGRNNAAVGFQLLGLFAAVEDRIVECFRQGSGVKGAAFPRYEAVRAEVTWAHVDANLLNDILPLVPGLPKLLRKGIEVGDVGCGYGHALNVMAEAFPASRFVGWNTSGSTLRAARTEALRKRLTNVRFQRRDAASLEECGRFDLITTFGSAHDHPRPDLLLRAIAHALREDGTYFCVEVGLSSSLADNLDVPWAPGVYGESCMHCVPLSLASGGAGLGAMWGQQRTSAMLAEAGFFSVVLRRAASDPLNNYYIATKRVWP